MAEDIRHSEYKYDVAFSLLDSDLSYAQRLEAKLNERFTTFLYSEQKKKLTWGDGADEMMEVYGRTARAVVLLMREGYGQTFFTKLEEQAIRSRLYVGPQDFLMMVLMEEMPSPTWLPRQYIFAKEEQWTFDELATAIAAKIKTLGGQLQKPTAIQLARNRAAERDWQERRALILNTEANGKLNSEYEQLLVELRRVADEMNVSLKNRVIQVRNSARGAVVILSPCSLSLFKTIEQDRTIYPLYHQLGIREHDGIFDENGDMLSRNAATWAESSYAIDVGPDERWFWSRIRPTGVTDSTDLANLLLTRLFERAEGVRTRKIVPQFEREARAQNRQSKWVTGWKD
ncbi:MAG: hypothetical protein ABI229_06195 [Gemmatimonadaceae bacterium]